MPLEYTFLEELNFMVRLLLIAASMIILPGCGDGGGFSGGDRQKAPEKKAEELNVAQATPTPSPSPSVSPTPSTNPTPPGGISKGRFTVWTVPQRPLPEQDYVIMIRVTQSPNGVRVVPADLVASVVGTDSYYFTTQQAYIQPGTIQIVPEGANQFAVGIRIPGAKYLVRNQVSVSLPKLGEQENFEILFN
jgi:hypothetical protein